MQTVTDDTVTPRVVPKAYTKPRWYWVLVVLLCAVIVVTAVPAFSTQPHSPSVEDFFPDAIVGEGTFYELNRLILARIVMGLALCLVVVLGVRRLTMVPGRGQAVLELAADFVRGGIAVQLLGPRNGKRFAPVLATLFWAVLAMNIAGIVPGIDIAASSVVAVPMTFAALTYVVFIGAGIRERGLGRFLASQLFPPGLPKGMYLLITPIEFLSNLVVRPVTLTLRLLCNMVSGHLLLGITYFGTTSLLLHLQVTSPLGALTGAAMVIMTLFEAFVAVLQAYIFTILSGVYIKLSIEAH